MGWKHLSVGVDVYALSLCLVKESLEVQQIVTGYDNKWSLFDRESHLCRLWIAVGLGVCLIEKSHAGEVVLTHLKYDWEQFIHAPVLTDCVKSFDKECVHFIAVVAKYHCMICIGSHTPDSK